MYSIETVVFKAKGRSKLRVVEGQWEYLLKGFVNSANQNTTAEVCVHELPVLRSKVRLELATNHYKLKKWRDIVKESKNPLVLCDTDICFLGDIEDGFTDRPITLTKRFHRWCNAGVVFVRPSKGANEFFDRWCEMDDWLNQGELDANGDPKRLTDAHKKTGVYGHNQTALALIKDEFEFGWVDGHVYNASLKKEWNSNPKVVHVKGGLRMDLLHSRKRGRYPILDRIRVYY
jgi:hypothetical protein